MTAVIAAEGLGKRAGGSSLLNMREACSGRNLLTAWVTTGSAAGAQR